MELGCLCAHSTEMLTSRRNKFLPASTPLENLPGYRGQGVFYKSAKTRQGRKVRARLIQSAVLCSA